MTIDAPITVARIHFDSSNTYTLAGTNVLTLDDTSDFAGAILAGVDFTQQNLGKSVDLSGAYLTQATNFAGAVLSDAPSSQRGVDLSCDLVEQSGGCDFPSGTTQFKGANMQYARLNHAGLSQADLEGTILDRKGGEADDFYAAQHCLKGKRIQDIPVPEVRARFTSALEKARAERAFLRQLGAGCHTAVGGFARRSGDELILSGLVASPDGSAALRSSIAGPVSGADALGQKLADELLARGARRLLDSAGETR